MSIRVFASALVAALLSGELAAAEPVRLTLANAFPTFDTRVAMWVGGLNKSVGNGLEIQIHDSVSALGGDQLKQLAQLRDGRVDMAVLVTNYYPSDFPVDDLAQLPGLFRSSSEGSLVMWRLQQQGLLPGYADFAALAVNTSANIQLHTDFEVRSLSRLRGARIRVGSTLFAPLPEEFGAEPVFMPFSEVMNGFRRGQLDGVITIPAALFSGARVAEVARYHLDAPLGQFTVALLMNKERFLTLPDAARAALGEQSGDALVRAWAVDQDAQNKASLERLSGMGQTLTRLAPDDGRRWREAIERQVERWIVEDPRRRSAYEAARDAKVAVAGGN